MPIKNLTDNVLPRFPMLGKLRKGGESAEKKNTKGETYNTYGPDLNYFRFTSTNPDIKRAFHEAYGKEPQSLHIYLPYVKIEDNFSSWKEQWSASSLLHRCDGETCVLWRTPQGKFSQEPKPCPGGCDEVGRLVMWLPELIRAGFVGYVTLETHSLHDLMNITATLQAVAQARGDNPAGLQEIEFILRRKLESISTPRGEGKRVRQDKWLVSIEPVASWASTYLSIAGAVVGALSHPGMVDAETGEIFDDEDDDDDGVEEGVFTPLVGVAATAIKREMHDESTSKKLMDKMRDENDHAPADDLPLFGLVDDNDPDPTIDGPGEKVWIGWTKMGNAIDWAYSVGFTRDHAKEIWNTVKGTVANAKDMPKPFYDTVLDHIASGGQDFEPTVGGGEKPRL